jgi:hypothetical protein
MYRTPHLEGIDVEIYFLSIAHHVEVRVGMAFQAILVGNLVVENPADFMRLMAIDAHGNLVGFLFPELAVNDLTMNLFDAPVTILAGGGDVITMDCGTGIGVRQYMMSRMAVAANGCHGQTLLE